MSNEVKNEVSQVENHDLVSSSDIDFVDGLLSKNRTYCSIDPKTQGDRMKIANAMNNPDKRISDCINEVIHIKDVYLETLMMKKKDDKGVEFGEASPVPRIVLFDEEGTSYQAVSVGLYSAIQKIMQIFGVPTWEEAIPVKVKQVTRGERKMLTLEVVSVAKKK